MYKVVNGLVDTVNSTGEITLDPSEADDPAKKVFSNFVLQEGALVDEQGEFAATEGVKTIKLSQGPVVEGSVMVYVTSPAAETTGAYTEVPSVYYASGSSDKIFEVVYDENYNATVVFGDGSVLWWRAVSSSPCWSPWANSDCNPAKWVRPCSPQLSFPA